MKKLFSLVLMAMLVLICFAACGSSPDDVVQPDEATQEDVGQTEQAVSCPQDVICPGWPAYSYSAGTQIACVYYPGGIVYKPKPAACQQCCPKWGTCVPGGCGSYPVYTNIWACRTGGSCSP